MFRNVYTYTATSVAVFQFVLSSVKTPFIKRLRRSERFHRLLKSRGAKNERVKKIRRRNATTSDNYRDRKA